MLLSLILDARAQTFSWDWNTDLPLTAAAGGTFVLLYTQVEPSLSPTGQVARTSGIDATGLTRTHEGVADASDVLLYGGLGLSAASVVVDGAIRRDGVGARVGVFAEAFAINGAITESLKLAVRRPRPYTAFAGADPALLAEVDSEMSFPSGHTSFTATAAFTAARMFDIGGATPGRAALGYGAATALTATVGTMRVVAGRHHPSDVIAGALIGGAVGWIVPTLHHNSDVALTASPTMIGVNGTF